MKTNCLKTLVKFQSHPFKCILLRSWVMIILVIIITTAGCAIQGPPARVAVKKEAYLIREPIDLSFKLENHSGDTIRFYIGAGRKDNFRFSAKDESGKLVPQLAPYNTEEQGEYPILKLEPNDVYRKAVFLNNYLSFGKPGTYTVNCAIDLHFFKASGPHEVRGKPEIICLKDTITIKLRRGSDKEIRAILDGLEAKLGSKDSKTQAEAAEALGSLRISLAIEYFKRALANRSFIVQYYAARGLSEIGTPEAIQGLIDALEYENITSRETAIEWLGYSRAKGALPKLIKLLDDENAAIRLATLRALSNIGDKSSIDAVRKRLDDPDQQVRETARKVLDYLQKQ